jgi:hypothetical protein
MMDPFKSGGEDIYEWHQSGRGRMRGISADNKRWI